MRTLVVAETVVDVVDRLPFPGGTGANVAIHATRLGGSVILASGVGRDRWGRWLHRWLDEEGVDLSYFIELAGCNTPISEVSLESDEPSIEMHADATPQILNALAPDLDRAVSAADAVFFASNTLCDPASREITIRARDLASAQGKPVFVDFNYRPNRWSGPEEAAREFLVAASGATLFKCNESEALVASGQTSLDSAAAVLAGKGYQHVLITLGAAGAMLIDVRGEGTLVPAPQVNTISTLGAGDALTGALLGALPTPAFSLEGLENALARAVEVAARSTEYLGAVAPES